MSRWSLALLVTLAAPAFAQAPEPATAEPAPATAPAPEIKEAPPAAAETKPPAEPPAAEEKTAPSAPAAENKAPPPAVVPANKPPAPAPAEAKAAPASPPPAAKVPPPTPAAAKAAPVAPPTPTPAPPAAPARPTPQVAAPAPAEEELDDEGLRRRAVKDEARLILENLLTGDARRAASEFLYPFQLEDKRYGTPEELVAAWVKQLRAKRTDLITLYDIEVLSLAEMEKKYGKAPARLGLVAMKDPDLYAAVGNLSGHAAVILFRAPPGAHPKAFAYTD